METKDEERRGVWLELHPGKKEEKVFTEMFNRLCFLFYQWLEVYVNWQLSTMLSKNSASWDHCADNTLLFTLLVLSPNIIPLPHTSSSPELGGLNTSFLPWRDRAVSSAPGEMAAVPWCHSDALALTDWRTKRWAGGKEGNQPLLCCSLKTDCQWGTSLTPHSHPLPLLGTGSSQVCLHWKFFFSGASKLL